MSMEIRKFHSPYDRLAIELAIISPDEAPKGVVVFSHGMAEHKERYFDFLYYLCDRGYVGMIHDHRGHGNSVRSHRDLGYLYTDDSLALVEDLAAVVDYAKNRYPNLPVYMFSHSMGTLVARNYLKRYDKKIDKLVLCGPPTKNPAAAGALTFANASKRFYKKRMPNERINQLVFGSYNKGYDTPFSWLSANSANVKAYIEDPLCGFTFTTNGFANLFQLQTEAFQASDWKVHNKKLPIFVIAGEDDPVIQSSRKFKGLITFLSKVGYSNVSSKLYPGLRHELLQEVEKDEVYADVMGFFSPEE